MNNTAGKRNLGLEYADHLFAERRHRSTIQASKKNRLGFPQIEHFDSWLIDILQDRMKEKHNILLYPSWINASALTLRTKEKFGFVCLASSELQQIINDRVQLPDNFRMTSSLKYLSEQTGYKIAPQPWGKSKEERELYPKLLLQEQQNGGTIEDQNLRISIAILPFVNGVVTPKIPVYNRLYANKFSKRQRITASQKEMKAKVDALAGINILTEIDDMEEFVDTSDDANAGGEDQIDFEVDTEQAQSEKRKCEAIQFAKESFPQSKHARLLPAIMPRPIPYSNPYAFQPIYNRVNFVASLPMTPLTANPNLNLRLSCTPQPLPSSGPRSNIRRCRLWCHRTDCEGGKTRWKKGETKHCKKFLLWWSISETSFEDFQRDMLFLDQDRQVVQGEDSVSIERLLIESVDEILDERVKLLAFVCWTKKKKLILENET